MRHRNTANTHDSSARTSPARPPADSALNLALNLVEGPGVTCNVALCNVRWWREHDALRVSQPMNAPQERAMKRTSCRFSRSLISANGRGDATILQPRARRPLHNTADLKERHEMDVHVKGRPSRSSPTRFGEAALLYGQWGRSQGNN